MVLKCIAPDMNTFPLQLRPFLSGAPLYDSSCSQEASVIFIDRDRGYFLKSAPRGSLAREVEMTRYFHGKGLAAEVLVYICDERDWLLTVKVPGDDCTASKYLENPKRLCDIIAERLVMLHSTGCGGCPIPNHTERYLAAASENYRAGRYDKSLFPDNWGYATPEEAWRTVETHGRLLASDTLLHGDCCLPNIIFDEWKFTGFVDVGSGGVGDRHVDLFWAAWSLSFNLKTDKYRNRFLDAYGREKVDDEMLRVVAAVEVFG